MCKYYIFNISHKMSMWTVFYLEHGITGLTHK